MVMASFAVRALNTNLLVEYKKKKKKNLTKILIFSFLIQNQTNNNKEVLFLKNDYIKKRFYFTIR